MEKQNLTAKQWLENELKIRRAGNPAYSLRRFAQHLGVSSGRLSEILAGKRQITLKAGDRMAAHLCMSPLQKEFFLNCIRSERGILNSAPLAANYRELSADQFQVIADWYHFAILSLMDLAEFSARPDWISRRLGISLAEARLAWARLRRLNLIRLEQGRWVKDADAPATPTDIEAQALRASHKQSLAHAIDALDHVPIELRDITSITMAIDVSRLKQAKRLIREFRRKICAYLEEGDPHEVYDLNIQLLPVKRRARAGYP